MHPHSWSVFFHSILLPHPITGSIHNSFPLSCFAFKQGHAHYFSGRAIWREPGFRILNLPCKGFNNTSQENSSQYSAQRAPKSSGHTVLRTLFMVSLWLCSNPVFSETPGPNCCFQDHQRKKKPLNVDFIMGSLFSHSSLQPGPRGLPLHNQRAH